MQGIVTVARINFDDDVEKQEQFWKLIEIVKGDRDRAYGRLIRFFRIAQKAYGHDQPMTEEQIHAVGLGDMIESGWAEAVPGGYHSVGAKKYFDWYRKKVQNGKLGGRPPEDPDDEPDQEPIGSPIAPPIPNPLAPAPVPALSQKSKIPDPVFARETRDQDQGMGPGAGMDLRPGGSGTGSAPREPEPLDFAAPELVGQVIDAELAPVADPPPPASNVITGRFPERLAAPPAPPPEPAPTPPRAPDRPPEPAQSGQRRVILPRAAPPGNWPEYVQPAFDLSKYDHEPWTPPDTRYQAIMRAIFGAAYRPVSGECEGAA